jgi:uncharacterized protein (DUF1330 family)
MAKAYLIAGLDVNNPKARNAYVSGAAQAFAEHGADFFVRGGRAQGILGRARARNVVIEFPSHRAAPDCYTSAAHRAARPHRASAATAEIVIVEGVEPQDQKG